MEGETMKDQPKTLGAYIARARMEMECRYPQVDDELCATALDAIDEFENELVKILPFDTPIIPYESGFGLFPVTVSQIAEEVEADILRLGGAEPRSIANILLGVANIKPPKEIYEHATVVRVDFDRSSDAGRRLTVAVWED